MLELMTVPLEVHCAELACTCVCVCPFTRYTLSSKILVLLAK